MKARLTALALVVAQSGALAAESGSQQPYIDQLKQGLEPQGQAEGRPDSFIQSERERLGKPEGTGNYIETLQRSLPEDSRPRSSLIESEKRRLGPGDPKGGAIQAVKEGHSELKSKRGGPIHHAAGFKFGTTMSRTIVASAGAGGRTFSEVYGDGFTPDLQGFYEYQPFHSEWFGNVGLVVGGGLSVRSGTGAFAFNLPKPGGGFFGTSSRTKFQFFTLPLWFGANYRFNLFRVLRPYLQVAGVVMGYVEMRSDERAGHRGNARGVMFSGGVNILLDWIAPSAAADLYHSFGIQHYYLTIDYTRLDTFSGDVDFVFSGLSLGMTYEF